VTAEFLSRWKAGRCARSVGRAPALEHLICPSVAGDSRNNSLSHRYCTPEPVTERSRASLEGGGYCRNVAVFSTRGNNGRAGESNASEDGGGSETKDDDPSPSATFPASAAPASGAIPGEAGPPRSSVTGADDRLGEAVRRALRAYAGRRDVDLRQALEDALRALGGRP
jgi:hypothetical protein